MKRTTIAIAILVFIQSALHGQRHIIGQVWAEAEPVIGASVWIKGGAQTATDLQGQFELQDAGRSNVELHISALGYQATNKTIPSGTDSLIDLGVLKLERDALGLKEIVVTGALRETFASDSPVRVQVVSGRFLERNATPSNLIESIKMINGLQEVVACGVCNTNSISINGLPGAYTAVLVDGAPVYGHLAAVYGLNGIPRAIIDRIEVVRGPGSTLFGPEAMAGVINIISKDPRRQSGVLAELSGSSYGEANISMMLAPNIKKGHIYLGVDGSLLHRYADNNADGFGDMALYDRWSFFSKWVKDDRWALYGKVYVEDRRNGVEAFTENHRRYSGSDSLYGERIFTQRAEFFGRWRGKQGSPWQFDFSNSWHQQGSYYGADSYRATQGLAMAQLVWRKETTRHHWTAGLSARGQYYDDNTVATPEGADKQFIPSIFLQDEWTFSPAFKALIGARLDYNRAHGYIGSPRANLKYKAGKWTTLRLNYGTGFRIVNLFTEDHAFITGQRKVVITEKLRPERSWNLSADANHIIAIGKGQGAIDIEGFFIFFKNKIIPNYSQPGFILYANTRGHASSKGLSARWSYQWQRPLNINLGFTWQEVTQTEPDNNGKMLTRPVLFAARWNANAAINYTFKKIALTAAYTLSMTGPMALPEVYDLDAAGSPMLFPRPLRSEPFAIHNIQITKSFEKTHLEFFGGLKNIGNYRQPISPLSGFNEPGSAPGFSPLFDTSYAYGPMQGRILYLGFRVCIEQE